MDSFFGLAFDLRALRLLDLVFPRRCAACGSGEELVCRDCRDALRRLDGTLCARCGAPTAWPVARCLECAGRRLAFASARAAVAYEGPARPLVAGWKDGACDRSRASSPASSWRLCPAHRRTR